MRRVTGGRLISACSFMFSTSGLAQGVPIESAARRQIDAGNQAWIDGMKRGNVGLIAATYTPDAVNCSSAWEKDHGSVPDRMAKATGWWLEDLSQFGDSR